MNNLLFEGSRENTINYMKQLVREIFLDELKTTLWKTQKQAEASNLNAIDTLVLINKNIKTWLSSQSAEDKQDYIDEYFLAIATKLKRPYVDSAKIEIESKITKIKASNNQDLELRINNFMTELNKKGINLASEMEKQTLASNFIKQEILRIREPQMYSTKGFHQETEETSCNTLAPSSEVTRFNYLANERLEETNHHLIKRKN